MTLSGPVAIDYFSDLLCIWAYAAEVRVEEVRRRFGSGVAISERFCRVFHDTETRIGEGWRERGGYRAFNAHLREVAGRFDHFELHPEVWLKVRPASSTGAHLFVKAVQLAERNLGLDAAEGGMRLPSQRTAWQLRLAFFRDCRDIARREVHDEVGERLALPMAAVAEEIASGRAFAALGADSEARERLRIEGSPTFVLNEGRQKLYGNVGYRVIEANIQELLKVADSGQASWC
jgi:predicted DsbA family dithiol-disulfide isomerase